MRRITRSAWRSFAPVFIGLALCVALSGIYLSANPGWTGAVSAAPGAAPTEDAPRTGLILLLEGPSVAEVYAAQMVAQQDGAVISAAAIAAVTQAHLAAVEAAQGVVVAALDEHDATLLYQVQRVYNGVAVHAPPDRAAALAALPGVAAVHPLIPKEPANGRAARTVGAPDLWQGGQGWDGVTGEGVTIAIIDTGIDYLHTMFGGPGSGYDRNDPTVIGDVLGFPGVKIIGGYDFVGDSYDASPTAPSYQPVPEPDPDPMDCYVSGHGTHVAGTAAGYGVLDNGLTYTGAYHEPLDLTEFRIAPGMAPHASLVALKVFGCTGSSEVVDMGLEWAVDPNGDGDFSDAVDIVNLSLGSSYGASFDSTALAVENATRVGVIVVASAGNAGDIHFAVSSPGIAKGAISVAAINGNAENGLEPVAPFSARGPRRDDGHLKPDLSAPGVTLFSAAKGTGNRGILSSGTSMAAPVVAGGMALLRQLHPRGSGWRPDELKALVMNTARIPLTDADGNPYSLLRVGAGRLDLTAARASSLIAYAAESVREVSVSFGVLDVIDSLTVVRQVRIANKSNHAITVTVDYMPAVALPGVVIDVDRDRTLVLPPRGFAGVPVTLSVDAAAMSRRPDPTRQGDSPWGLTWLDEVGGYLRLTPSQGPTVHVPIHAAPRPASQLSLEPPSLDFAAEITATAVLTVGGAGLFGRTPPTVSVPLVGLFELHWLSAPIVSAPNDDPVLSRYAPADLQAIGVQGPTPLNGEDATLYFGLSTYGQWATPQAVTFVVEIDVDRDALADFILVNRNAGYVSFGGLASVDDFIVVLEEVDGTFHRVQGPLNAIAATDYESRLLWSNVMTLPLRLRDLRLAPGSTQLRYRVLTYSRDVGAVQTPNWAVDRTPWMTVDWEFGVGLAFIQDGEPSAGLRAIYPDDTVEVDYNREAFLVRGSKDILALHHHNVGSHRVQIIPVGVIQPTYRGLFPIIYGPAAR